MSVASSAQAYHNNMVGPVMRAGDLALAVIEAAKVDNPGKEVFVDDKRADVRIHTEQEMILRRQTIDLSQVNKVVLDEADEMMRLGFIEDQAICGGSAGGKAEQDLPATPGAPLL